MSKNKRNTETSASSLANTPVALTGEAAILSAIDKLKNELFAKMEANIQNATIDQLR